MGVDYSVAVLYGFEIDMPSVMQYCYDAGIDFYELKERICEESNCEITLDNLYCEPQDARGFFGVSILNRITAETLAEIERDRQEEVCDTFIQYFGSYDFLCEDQGCEPEIQVTGVIW